MTEKEEKVVRVGLIILLHVWFLSVCAATNNKTCTSSSCGGIQIRNPFRLEGDSTGCGDPEYELVCKNNRTISNRRYYVKQINYDNYTITVVVPGIEKGNCFSTPLYSLTTYYGVFPYTVDGHNTIVLMNCTRPISDPNYIPITPCNTSTNASSSSSSSQSYSYALVGDSKEVGDLPYSCTFGATILTGKFQTVSEPPRRSMSDLQESLITGLEVSFLRSRCSECHVEGLDCLSNFTDNTIQCYKWKTKEYCEFRCRMKKKKKSMEIELCNSLKKVSSTCVSNSVV